MILKDCSIKPGIGFDIIQFGMTKDEVITLIGNPDKEEKNEYGQTTWHYDEHYYPTVQESILSLSFYEEDDNRLSEISFTGSVMAIKNKELALYGVKLANLTIEEIKNLLLLNNGGEIKIEKKSWMNGQNLTSIASENLCLTVNFIDDRFEWAHMTPFFADDDHYQWPK